MGSERPLSADLLDIVETLAPVAARLGCARELAEVRAMVEDGASVQSQLKVADAAGGHLRAVVDHLAHELREGMDAGPGRPDPRGRTERSPG